ncbi:hypothetical protein DSO57_1036418 [Entomophthora muscae]|uniref:Uncharacterized protein n=3 Tax=Entomophthora muscae TaxID=34485 RepID=A0ACC2RNK5_9FUNG|nr:hypothetical protein DSO57_1002363 [Entomophthora muscae]KAJ9071328.1 hypothetical protein DSO57_1038044 [Entomophthora muscae]KAJ9079331.1 hypothetical protein DSO57_1036418 [Entomophthora muscae]
MLVMSYGQPKVANQVFVNYFRSFGFPYMSIVNQGDWIAHLRSSVLVHIGNEIHVRSNVPWQCRNRFSADPKCSSQHWVWPNPRPHLTVGTAQIGIDGC